MSLDAGRMEGPRGPAGGELFDGRAPGDLTLTNAFEAAFRGLTRPAFIGPILVFACLINAFLELLILRDLMATIRAAVGGAQAIPDLDRLLLLFGISFAVTFVGGMLIAVYGQVWAAAASIGPFPDVASASALAGQRWVGVLGTSIVVALLLAPVIVIGSVLIVALGRGSPAVGFLLAIMLVVPFVWLSSRLSMAVWLVADGVPIRESIRASWRITRGGLLRILGWSLATGLAFALLSAGLSAVLQVVPLVGGGIAQGISYALTYGAAVTLYRRTQAAASPRTPVPAAPSPVAEAPLG